MKEFDFSVSKTANPLELKDRMLELQNEYTNLAGYYIKAKLEKDSLEACLGYIRDKAFLMVETGTVEEKKSRSKTDIKVKVSYLKDGGRVDIELSYHNCKFLLLKAESRMSRLWLYLDELKSAIEVCRSYPVRGLS